MGQINGVVWGPVMLALILGTGLFLQLRLGMMPVRRIGAGFRLMWRGRTGDAGAAGEVSPFAALMTCLSATVGVGNIAGVATAIALGGPGAVFWMWMTALVGMATKYAEIVLAVHFRERDEAGHSVGGPMYAIKNGLGRRWAWLGTAFALFGGLAGFGIGNMVQSNTIASALANTFGIDALPIGVTLLVLTSAVVLGGIRRIAAVANSLVPFMIVAYVAAAMIVLITHAGAVPAAFLLIVESAFSPVAATGGFAGAAVMAAMRFGIARGIFSNEAGLGSAGIAQAAGQSSSPVRSGLIGMMGTFIDTIVVCSMTALAIVVSGAWQSGETGAVLTQMAFESAMPGWGGAIIAASITVFAFTTIFGWAYYGERCWQFLVGSRAIMPYRIIWCGAVFAGAVTQLDFAWQLADTLNALMAVPNLIALIALSPVIVTLTRRELATALASGPAQSGSS
ncbi:MAG: sodium:alanine symporter family protein [Steroidobacteraceae bacterium]